MNRAGREAGPVPFIGGPLKRAITAKGAKGSPPLPRQRKALRVVQLCLLVLAVISGRFALQAWSSSPAVSSGLGEVVVFGALGMSFAGLAAWMGIRTVRGPQPPTLE